MAHSAKDLAAQPAKPARQDKPAKTNGSAPKPVFSDWAMI